jgi:hypothetical protein
MKKTVFLILIILVAFQTVGFSQKKTDKEGLKADTISADSLEYRIIILDPGFETWLLSQPPEHFYSNDYYIQKNRFYVSEWNQRYTSSNDNDLFDNYIYYDPQINYGIDINYKLYYFFKYFEAKNHINLLNNTQ